MQSSAAYLLMPEELNKWCCGKLKQKLTAILAKGHIPATGYCTHPREWRTMRAGRGALETAFPGGIAAAGLPCGASSLALWHAEQ